MKPDCVTLFTPPWAVRLWTDTRNIYVEIPAKEPGNPPLVLSYPHSENGLGKVLNLMRDRWTDSKPHGGYYQPPQPCITQPQAKLAAKGAKPEDREAARQVLVKAGILKV